MPQLPIPNTPDEITPEWLTEALRSTGKIDKANVTSVSAKTIAVGQGFTSQMARLTLEYDAQEEGAPKTLIAKLPLIDETIRGLINQLRIYERENKFYEDIAPYIEMRTPRRYYSASDVDAGDHVLLLEDMAPALAGNNVRGCSVEQANLIVKSIARFHAFWWNSPRLSPLGWLPSLEDSAESSQQIYQQMWEPFVERLGNYLPQSLKEIGERFATNVVDVRSKLAGPPETIVHGDYRLDNMFFGHQGSGYELAVIDWQAPLRGVGVSDVAYFFAFCVDPEQRRATESDLLKTYYESLIEGGVVGYDFDQCLYHYRLSLLQVLHRIVIAGGLLDFESARGRALVATLIQRSASILEDHNVIELLP